MSISMESWFLKNFQKTAVRRGYSNEQQQAYANDRLNLVKNQPLTTDKVLLGTAIGTAGNIAFNAKVKKMGFKDAVKKQFKPLTKEINKILKGTLKSSTGKSRFVKNTANALIMSPLRATKGLVLSIPKAVGVLAGVSLAGVIIKNHLDIMKLNKKYDAMNTSQ